MRLCKPIVVTLTACLLCLSLLQGPQPASARQALPALPSVAVRQSVIQASGGPQHTTLGIPPFISSQLVQFVMRPFTGIRLDGLHTAHYIDLKSTIRQTLIPRIDAPTLSLNPNTVTPDDGKPAMVVGGYYDALNGPRMLLATWTSNKPGQNVDKLRLYKLSNGVLSYITPFAVHTFRFQGINGQESPGDVGVLIATDENCFAIGLDQLCFDSQNALRDKDVPALVDAARNSLSNAYSYSANFNHSQAVPDLIGAGYRHQCADSVAVAAGPTAIPNCAPDVVFVANDHPDPGEPIALFNVLRDNDMETYDVNGALVGHLPAGYYLVMDASVTTPQPGTNSVLFLVSVDGQHNYLIPSQAIEGFAASPFGTMQVAAIKDGTTSGWRF